MILSGGEKQRLLASLILLLNESLQVINAILSNLDDVTNGHYTGCEARAAGGSSEVESHVRTAGRVFPRTHHERQVWLLAS